MKAVSKVEKSFGKAFFCPHGKLFQAAVNERLSVSRRRFREGIILPSWNFIPVGCTRKLRKPLGKLSGVPESPARCLGRFRESIIPPQCNFIPIGCSRRLRKKLKKLSGAPERSFKD
jgi:hypothetical protein